MTPDGPPVLCGGYYDDGALAKRTAAGKGAPKDGKTSEAREAGEMGRLTDRRLTGREKKNYGDGRWRDECESI